METNCTETIPHSREYLQNLGSVGLGLVISTGISTLLTVSLSVITLVQVTRNVQQANERVMSWWLVGICPVVGVTSFIGIISPRSVHIDELVSAIYVSLSVAVFFRLMLLYHGGEEALCLNLKGVKLPMSKPPFCCCICLRNVYINRRTLRRIKIMVYQILVTRPLLLYADAVIKSEEEVSSPLLLDNPVKALIGVLTNISTIMAFLGLVSTFRLSLKPLKAHGIVPKFLYVKLILVFCDPQGMLVKLLVTAGVLPCSDLFYHGVRGETLKFVLLCFEMIFLAVLGYWQFGKEVQFNVSDNEMESNGKGKKAIDLGLSTDI